MAEYPALPLFTDAYIADTRHLTTLQHGAYLLMLMVAWRSPDCSLPNDDAYLARITGMDRRTWNANKSNLLGFWTLNDHHKWEQGRLKDERKYVEQLSNKNSDNAKARWLKYKEPTNATALPERCQTDAPTPTPTKETPIPPFFDRFWIAFPKGRIGSQKRVLKAWNSAIKRTTPERLLDAAIAYAQSDEVKRGFAKGAAAWLNDDRWNVDYRPPQRGPREVLG